MDPMLKVYTRNNSEAVELLFAFQGTADTNIIDIAHATKPRRDLRTTYHNDFKLDTSGSSKDNMGIRTMRVHYYVNFLHKVWTHINNAVTTTNNSRGGKKLILRTTGHSAGGALSEMTALILANRFKGQDDVWVEGFSFNPVAAFDYEQLHMIEDEMGSCHYQHHAFHAIDDPWVRAANSGKGYIGIKDEVRTTNQGGSYVSEERYVFTIDYESNQHETACGYVPYHYRSGGGHEMHHWVNSSINAISNADALSLFSSTIPGEDVEEALSRAASSSQGASAIAPF